MPAVEIEYGTFLSSAIRAPLLQCGADGQPVRVKDRLVVRKHANGRVAMEWVHKSEEKGSDVNLASHLLKDAFEKDCECAVVVSNDSDLLTPIRMAQGYGIVVGLVTPRPTGSVELRKLADFQKNLRKHHLAAAQFPKSLKDAHGSVTKPGRW